MNEKTAMIIDIPFNVAENPFWPGFTDQYDFAKSKSQTKEWIDYRIDIFMKYTAFSLINQTNQDFKCVVRYSKKTENLIFDALSRYPKLPENIVFTDDGDKYIQETIDGYKYIYHIRIDSDNMFNKDYIENLHKFDYYEGLECILCQNGYIYDTGSDRLATMFHGSPSFYALVYTVDDFLVGFKHSTEPDHWGAASLVNEKIDTPSYLVVVHGQNMSNDFDVILDYAYVKTSLVNVIEKDKVLQEFGLK